VAEATDAEGRAAPSTPATGSPGPFERDTAVTPLATPARESSFAATVADGWRAGRGPHGGYLAAIILRALTLSVADPARSPRSLTIHYLRAPVPGPVTLHTTLEREGRSLSTLSARMEQDGALVALALAAFSVPWNGPELLDLRMPEVQPPQGHEAGTARSYGAPPFTDFMVMQPRLTGRTVEGRAAMEFSAWLGLAEARPLDALALAFFCDALIPSPFPALGEFAPAPTIDLTIHFRVTLPRAEQADEQELCFAQVKSGLIHEGFFEEDGVIWAADGTVLAQSRQLALLMSGGPPPPPSPAGG
jgi:acyl-CoA thioesterase